MPSEEKFAEVTRKSKAKRAEMKASAEVQRTADLQKEANEETARTPRERIDATSRTFAAFEDKATPEHD
jgi:hypothetical protein